MPPGRGCACSSYLHGNTGQRPSPKANCPEHKYSRALTGINPKERGAAAAQHMMLAFLRSREHQSTRKRKGNLARTHLDPFYRKMIKDSQLLPVLGISSCQLNSWWPC